MKSEQAIVDAELKSKDRSIKLEALVDTGVSKSMISSGLANKLGAFTPLKGLYELRTADEKGRLRVVGYCRVKVIFQGVEDPGRAV